MKEGSILELFGAESLLMACIDGTQKEIDKMVTILKHVPFKIVATHLSQDIIADNFLSAKKVASVVVVEPKISDVYSHISEHLSRHEDLQDKTILIIGNKLLCNEIKEVTGYPNIVSSISNGKVYSFHMNGIGIKMEELNNR